MPPPLPLVTHPLTLSHPNLSFSYLLRTPLWFGVLLTLDTSLPPANQPTNQPRASLMLLLQISGRLLGCLPAGTIGRCVFPSSSHLSLVIFLFFSFFIPSFVLHLFPSSLRCLIFPPSLSCPYLHFILRHAPLLSFSFPEDTHSFVTIVGNGEEVDESMASASSWLVLIWL